jgi:hypothetical protein
MSFDFGKWRIRNGRLVREKLRYSPCCCKEKFSFKTGSTLLSYLETQCYGWTPDPTDEYTLNYILIVLIANLNYKNLLNKRYEHWVIDAVPSLEPVLNCGHFSLDRNFYFISELRPIVANFHCNTYGVTFTESPPFICPYGLESIIRSIFGISEPNSRIYRFYRH